MFYRIKDNKICDYADYKYADDCLETELCTMNEFNENKEIYNIENDELFVLENSDEIVENKYRTRFEKEFFNTSLGWIRRKVNMKDGSVKDFLADLLLPIKAGLELGREVEIITYNEPDFFNNTPTDEYLTSLQERKLATADFIEECLVQTVNDFGI